MTVMYAADSALGGASGETESAGGSGGAVDAGASLPAWAAQLPMKFRSDPDILDTPTLGDFFERKYMSTREKAKSYEGKQIIPGKDAKPDEIANFRKILGVPDSATDYGDEVTPGQNETFLKAGLTKAQVAEINAAQTAMHKAQNDKKILDNAHDNNALIDHFKEKFRDKYDGEMGKINQFIKKFIPPQAIKKIESAGLGNSIELFEVFHELSSQFSEHAFREGSTVPDDPVTSRRFVFDNERK
jgi:hypothetical protein